MIWIIKDIISLFIYAIICPFFKNKSAILVYHSIGYINKDTDPKKINVNPELFEKHMAYLEKRRQGFLVTFDDGYKNIYLNALPVIKKYRIKSILFLTTDYLDGKIKLDNFFDNKYSPGPLTWDQAKEINKCGIELGSHSLTHKNMFGLNEEMAYLEALLSKKRIAEMTEYMVSSFAYPFGNAGSFNAETERILKSAGYKKAYTNIMGMDNSQEEPFTIKRIRIYNTDNIFRFKMKISGAYNWVDLLVNILRLFVDRAFI